MSRQFEAENWFTATTETAKAVGHNMAPPYDNIFIGCDPLDGMTPEVAKSFQAIVNVSCTPCAYFYPAYPGQYMHWFPTNEMGYWGYVHLFYIKQVLDFHHAKGHRVYLHCLPRGTDVLTKDGWVEITQLKNKNEVIAFDPNSNKYKMSEVNNHFVRKASAEDQCYSVTSKRLNKSIVTTAGHRNPFKLNMGITTGELPEETFVKDWIWSGYGFLHEKEYVPTDVLLFLAWVVGDGSVFEHNKTSIPFHFKKQRKINRVIELAESLGFGVTATLQPDGTTGVYVSDKNHVFYNMVGKQKEYPMSILSKITQDQAKMFIEELVQVDGDYENYVKKGAIRLNTKRKSDVDFLTALISLHYGVCTFNLVKKESNYAEDHLMYYVNAIPLSRTEKCKSGFNNTLMVKEEIEYDGDLSCFTVDTGFFLARQNGITFVTGNCHAGAYRSPSAAMLWLMSKGHSLEEAYCIHRNDNTLVERYKKEDDGRMWKYVSERWFDQKSGNVPDKFIEFFDRYEASLKKKNHNHISIADLLLRNPWIENTREVFGDKRARRQLFLENLFPWYFEAKSYLRELKVDFKRFMMGRKFEPMNPGSRSGIISDDPTAKMYKFRQWLTPKVRKYYDKCFRGY